MCVKSTGTMGCIDFVLPGCISTRLLASFRKNQQHASKPDLEALLSLPEFRPSQVHWPQYNVSMFNSKDSLCILKNS